VRVGYELQEIGTPTLQDAIVDALASLTKGGAAVKKGAAKKGAARKKAAARKTRRRK
jgi:hypothetical protein